MKIGGILDISTKDIPNKACMVIFTVGCNFKCEFCHNKYLQQNNVGKEMSIDDLIEKVKSNLLVNSVCISGGEPTLQKDLVDLCKRINELEKYISIDTNGSNPKELQVLISYINRVALDIKGPLEGSSLENITGVKINPETIIHSFDILNENKEIDFEIRTTFVEPLMVPNDINKIISFLREHKFRGIYVLQQYQFSEGVGEKVKEKFQNPEHFTLLEILKPYKDLELPFKIFLRDDIVGYCSIDRLYDYLEVD